MFPLRDSIPSRRIPFVNYALIAINLLIFFKEYQLAQTDQLQAFIQTYGLVPARFLADPLNRMWEVFTAMFLHGGWMHVIGNMWFLYVFGDNIEDNLGHVLYLFYYLLMGVGAAATQLAASPHSQLPMVGASGAIAGILGSYVVLHPNARIHTFFIFVFFIRFIEVPAFFFLGYWFLIQAINGFGTLAVTATRGEVGGVAWWAHAGGFVAGFIGIMFVRRRRHI